MKVLSRSGAAGQLGQAMAARLSARRARGTAWTRQDIDLTRHQRRARGDRASWRPRRSSTARATTRSMRAEDDQRTALDVNAMVGRHAGARRRGARRGVRCTTAPTSSSPAPRRRPTPKPTRPSRAASMRNRSWSASGWPPMRRSTTCCGSRACSADRIAAAASIASSIAVRAGQPAPVFVDRVVSPSFVADVADASAFMLRTRPGVRPLSLRQFRPRDVARRRPGDRQAARRDRTPLLKPMSVNDVTLRAPRPQFAALSNAEAGDAPATRCRPGRTRSAAISSLVPNHPWQGENGGSTDQMRIAVASRSFARNADAARRAVGAVSGRHVQRIGSRCSTATRWSRCCAATIARSSASSASTSGCWRRCRS